MSVASLLQSLLKELEQLQSDKLAAENALQQSLAEATAGLAEANAANEKLRQEKQVQAYYHGFCFNLRNETLNSTQSSLNWLLYLSD